MKETPRDTLNRALEECKGFTPGPWIASYSGLDLGTPGQEITNYGIYRKPHSPLEWFLEASNDSFDFDETTWPTVQLAAMAPSLLSALTESVAREERVQYRADALEEAVRDLLVAFSDEDDLRAVEYQNCESANLSMRAAIEQGRSLIYGKNKAALSGESEVEA